MNNIDRKIRKIRKAIGGAMMFTALMFGSPPFDMIPNDFLNIFLAMAIISLTGLDKLVALFFTYTLIPVVLFSIGVFIFPVKGSRAEFIINIFRKIVRLYMKILKKPLYLAIALIMFIAVYYIYAQVLITMI